jgi:hypothetical protein
MALIDWFRRRPERHTTSLAEIVARIDGYEVGSHARAAGRVHTEKQIAAASAKAAQSGDKYLAEAERLYPDTPEENNAETRKYHILKMCVQRRDEILRQG